MMTTHYRNTAVAKDVMDVEATEETTVTPHFDNSGLRIFVTQNLRIHDAGVLSIGKFKQQSTPSSLFRSITKLQPARRQT